MGTNTTFDTEDNSVKKSPPHPGGILKRQFLDPLDVTQTELADRMGVPYPRVNEIINGKRGITPESALMLARVFDNSAGFWLNLQQKYDLYKVEHGPRSDKLKDIEPLS